MLRLIGDILQRMLSTGRAGAIPALLVVLAVGVVPLLSGQALSGQALSGQALAGQAPPGYRIAAGDRLAVGVVGHAELSGEAVVDDSGRAALPLIGSVPAAGKTVAELRDYIALALDGGYVLGPQVTVEVLNYRPVEVLGEVENPGRYAHVQGMTVAMAVEAAGGFTRQAYVSMVVLVHGDDPDQTPLEVGPDAALRPGDAIEVARKLY